MKSKPFKVSKFKNRSGASSYRVSGTINGGQIRKNFRTRQEAIAEKQVLEIQRLNSAGDLKTIATSLTAEQTREAESVYRLLGDRGLSFAVRYFLDHYREPESNKALEEAISEYLHQKSKQESTGLISSRQLSSLRKELNRFGNRFATKMIGEVTFDEIKRFLEENPTSLKTWNNRRGYLNTFFRFCNQNEYRSDNPISKIKHHKIKKSRGTAVTLSASDAESLMSFLENFDGLTDDDRNSGKQGTPGILVNYFALCLFAGIRPDWKYGEISKLRPSHLNLETGVIHVEPEVSKTNEKRNVSIQPNLLEWIQRYPLETYAIIPPRFRDLRLEIRKKFDLTHDVLRHTYISMLIARDRSVGDAALNAGNTEYVIRRHYMDVVSESEAEKFWNIIPLKGSEKIIPMNQSGVAP